MCINDTTGLFVSVNDGYRRLLGYETEDLVGRRGWDIVHPDDLGAALAGYERLFNTGETSEVELRLRTIHGEYRWFSWTSRLLPDRDLVYSVGRDITPVRKALADLANREQMMRAVLRASPDIIIIIDHAGQVTSVSPAVSATLGYDLPVTASFPQFGPRTSDTRTLSGSDLLALVHEEDRDTLASAFLRLAQGIDDSMHATCRIRHREGHWVVLEARGRPIVGMRGQPVGAVIVSRDVSEDLRTREELHRAKEVAERANRAKNDFLSRMSHEIRTPLNAVLGFAQLLDGSDLSSDQQRAVDHILRAGSHLLDLIDDVLDVSRIEAGRLRLSTEPVDAERAVADVCALVQPLAAEHTVEVIQLGGEPNLRVAADSRRLVQVLLNLLTNSIKYNRPGGRVEVGWRRQGERVRFEVRDDGIGIQDEDLPLVFAPFERIRGDSAQPDGAGVGLALSKLLVEAMGGSIGLKSQVGHGSTFWFDLPVADAA